MAVKGDAAQLIQSSGGGFCALPENEVSLAETVVKMANLPSKTLVEMGIRNKNFYNENLSLEVGVRKFLSVFRAVRALQSR